jgi:cytochrome c2
MGRDERRSTAPKRIEDYSIAFRDILDRVGNHCGRVHRWTQREALKSKGGKWTYDDLDQFLANPKAYAQNVPASR